MKSRNAPLLILALIGGLSACASSSSDKVAIEAGAMAAGDEMPMPMPTAEHKEILSSVGMWEGTMTAYMPGAPAEPIAARETVTAIGGFWTQARFECDFMGMPYVGTGAFGFDPERGKYVGTWIDSMGSYLAVMEGEKNSAGNVVMRWNAPDMTGKIVEHRNESVRSANAYTMTFYTGDTKSMVISMKRKR